MIAVVGAVLFGLVVVAWYMQRRAPRELALSFARLLPDPPEVARPEPRFSFVPPLRSVPFWLHFVAVLLALAALFVDLKIRQGHPGKGIGLRVVLDISDSMGVSDGAATRLELAIAEAERQVRRAREASAGTSFCGEAFLVGSTVQTARLERLSDVVAPQPEGGDVAALLRAAVSNVNECPVTHVVVVSDLPLPASPWPQDGPVLIWRQVGASQPNAGIASARYTPPRLGGAGAELMLTVETYGELPTPRLTVNASGGTQSPRLEPSLDRPGRYIARLAPRAGGNFIATLEGGGAYRGDDRVTFHLDVARAPALDWRLQGLPAPRGTVPGADAVVTMVGGLSQAPDGVPVLAAHDGWAGRVAPGRLGAFLDDPVLDPINLDALEQRMPAGLQGPLPEGFVPVLTAQDGAVLVARRGAPPGLIVPAPVASADPEVKALSYTLFFSALQEIAGVDERPVNLEWKPVGRAGVAQAWKESDTARALVEAEEVNFATGGATEIEAPIWPWLVLAALCAVLAERLWALRDAWRGRSKNAV